MTTLTKKRDEISAAIANYEKRLAQARADLAHVTATLTIFEGGGEPGSHRVYVDLLRVFRYGEIGALCVAELANGERTTRQLADMLLRHKGLDPKDRVLAKTLCLSVVHSMRGMTQRRKAILVTKRAGVCVWALPQAALRCQ
ncbi:MAG: hypothetical protein JSR55_08760 [Proteobacteria bacterium]|nr:hypothetical protein [Pseudomonadota bacterium]